MTVTFTACGEVSPPITEGGVTFNQAAASKLTPEQIKKMDIEFFNYFDVKNGYGANKEEQIKDRTDRMVRLAEAGFEPAWLALRLYNFPTGGQTRFSGDYPIYWHRLKALADSGDASAQCFFGDMASEYADMNEVYRKNGYDMPDLPTQETHASLWVYSLAAAKQGQVHCQRYAAGEAEKTGDTKKAQAIIHACALQGDGFCESSIGLSYARGYDGYPRDDAKALCWYKRAHQHGQPHFAESGIVNVGNDLLFKLGSNDKRDLILTTITDEMDCDTAVFNWDVLKGKGK